MDAVPVQIALSAKEDVLPWLTPLMEVHEYVHRHLPVRVESILEDIVASWNRDLSLDNLLVTDGFLSPDSEIYHEWRFGNCHRVFCFWEALCQTLQIISKGNPLWFTITLCTGTNRWDIIESQYIARILSGSKVLNFQVCFRHCKTQRNAGIYLLGFLQLRIAEIFPAIHWDMWGVWDKFDLQAKFCSSCAHP